MKTTLRRTILVAATMAIAIIGTSAALADDPPTLDCTIRFQLSGWSAIYESVDGTGIVAYVHQISDVLGTYAQGDVHADLVKSGQAQSLTNGKVSLALAGKGEGYDLGIGIAGFTIRVQ